MIFDMVFDNMEFYYMQQKYKEEEFGVMIEVNCLLHACMLCFEQVFYACCLFVLRLPFTQITLLCTKISLNVIYTALRERAS